MLNYLFGLGGGPLNSAVDSRPTRTVEATLEAVSSTLRDGSRKVSVDISLTDRSSAPKNYQAWLSLSGVAVYQGSKWQQCELKPVLLEFADTALAEQTPASTASTTHQQQLSFIIPASCPPSYAGVNARFTYVVVLQLKSGTTGKLLDTLRLPVRIGIISAAQDRKKHELVWDGTKSCLAISSSLTGLASGETSEDTKTSSLAVAATSITTAHPAVIAPGNSLDPQTFNINTLDGHLLSVTLFRRLYCVGQSIRASLNFSQPDDVEAAAVAPTRCTKVNVRLVQREVSLSKQQQAVTKTSILWQFNRHTTGAQTCSFSCPLNAPTETRVLCNFECSLVQVTTTLVFNFTIENVETDKCSVTSWELPVSIVDPVEHPVGAGRRSAVFRKAKTIILR